MKKFKRSIRNFTSLDNVRPKSLRLEALEERRMLSATDITAGALVDNTASAEAALSSLEQPTIDISGLEVAEADSTTKQSLATPKVTVVSIGSDYIEFSWDPVEGADSYDCYVACFIGGAFPPLMGNVDTTDTTIRLTELSNDYGEYHKFSDGDEVFFAVKACADDTNPSWTTGAYSPDAYYNLKNYLTTPVVSLEGEPTDTSAKFVWEAVEGAGGYNISYSINGGASVTAATFETSCVITADPESKISISVTAIPSIDDTEYVESLSGTASATLKAAVKKETLATPKVTVDSVGADYVELSWDPVEGADSYTCFIARFIGGGTYYLMGEVNTTETSIRLSEFTGYDGEASKLSSGDEVCLQVKAGAEADNPEWTSGDYSSEIWLWIKNYLATPSVTVEGDPTDTSAKFVWETVEGAVSYNISYSINGGTPVVKTTTDTNYVVTADPESSISISVTAVPADDTEYVESLSGTASATLKAAVKKETLATPKVTVDSVGADYVELSWNPIEGADSYTCFIARFIGGGSNYLMGEVNTTETSIRLSEFISYDGEASKLSTGDEVCLQVKGIAEADNLEWTSGDYSSEIWLWIKNYLATPVVSLEGEPTDSSAKFVWEEVEGAGGYNISYSINGGASVTAATFETSCVINADPESNISISVTAIPSIDDTEYVESLPGIASATLKAAVKKETLATPNVIVDSVGADYVDLSWDPVEGADSYNCFIVCFVGGGVSYVMGEVDTTETSIRWSEFTTYDGVSYKLSAGDEVGLQVKARADASNPAWTTGEYSSETWVWTKNYLATPVVSVDGEPTDTSAKFVWEAVEGAVSYNISYSINGGTPVTATTTDANYSVTADPESKITFSATAVPAADNTGYVESQPGTAEATLAAAAPEIKIVSSLGPLITTRSERSSRRSTRGPSIRV